MAQVRSKEQLLFVVGASAGGIDALERLLSALPADFSAPIVIAQHLDPSRASRLEAILQHSTPLKVTTAGDSTALVPGTIYVVPAGRHAEINDGTVAAVARKETQRAHPQPSIDLLFSSAAATHGDRTVAVVLSGTGSDGAAGAEAVKEAGGIVVIQNPATAAYPGLPASILPVHVDLVSDIDTMGSLLASIADTDGSHAGVDGDMLHAFLSQLRTRSGIDFTQYKAPTIVRRLSRLMAAARCTTLSDYMRFLNANPDAYHRLISSFLIKVTGFFRDPALYQYLREQLLPELIALAKKNKSDLRLWSAGCATGEEAYSLAILLAEILGDDLDNLDIRIFATDLDGESIAFARRGVYPENAFSDMPPELQAKYFTKVDGAYQVKKKIRNLTVFGEYDLGQRAPFPRIDLILCRNVLIYFTKELQYRTLQLFAFSLREGGYLVLGKSESTSPLPQFFAGVHPILKVFRRQGDRVLMPAPAFSASSAMAEGPTLRRNALRAPSALRRGPETLHRSSVAERLGSFLFDSPLGVLVVDRNYDIQTINQAARTLLGIHGQGIGDDLIHLASGVESQDLKGALDAAFRSETYSNYEMTFSDAAMAETKYLQVSTFPDRLGAKDEQVTGAIVLVQDVTQQSKRRRQAEEEFDSTRRSLTQITRQNEELLERQRSLVDANNELSVANNELRNTNEHLLIAAEEAEASAEEVETLNEEMQATGEELETLNEELQATIEELNTTNEELAARGGELERLANERLERLDATEAARALLAVAIEKAPVAVAVLDPDGHVTKTSSQYAELLSKGNGLPKPGEPWKAVKLAGYTTREIDLESGRLVVLMPV